MRPSRTRAPSVPVRCAPQLSLISHHPTPPPSTPQVRDILQLEATDPGANAQRVDAALNMLRGAIHNWGGAVEVVSVENHVAVLRWAGEGWASGEAVGGWGFGRGGGQR